MQEPALRLVTPDPGDGRAQVPPWRATSQPRAAGVAPGDRATNGATDTATERATNGATIPATEPGPAVADGATNGATNGDASPATGGAATAMPAATGGGPLALPALQPMGRPPTPGERAARLVRHWTAAAREDAMRPGELLHAIYHGKPNSLAEIHDYALSRAWVPDGHEGQVVPVLGAAYSHTIAKGGTALGLSIIWVTQRALRLITFAFVCGVLVVLIIAFS
jgi:hypothetical protein